MTYERAAEILDPEHRETYESLEIVNEACRMGRAALFRRMPEPPHPDGDESLSLIHICISQCTVYTELKRGQETDERTGETVLDHNFRPEYKAERGEKTYQSNLRKRGRRPKAAPSMKGA